MKLVFICSPYRGDIEKNVENARAYCKMAIDAGHVPIAPHLYFTQFTDDDDLGIEMGIKLLDKCDELWVGGDTISSGMRQEINHVTMYRKEIKFVTLEGS